MSVDEFLQQLTDALEAEEPLRLGQALSQVVTWDSLGVLAAVDVYEQIGAEVDLDSINNAQTTDDLIALASPAVSV